jgi:hypothetical protein
MSSTMRSSVRVKPAGLFDGFMPLLRSAETSYPHNTLPPRPRLREDACVDKADVNKIVLPLCYLLTSLTFAIESGLLIRLLFWLYIRPLVAAILAPEDPPYAVCFQALMDDNPHRLAPDTAERRRFDARPRHPLKE